MAAARPRASQLYRNEQLGDMAAAIDRMTLGAADFEPPEPLVEPSFQRILVAIDGSPGSRHALEWAAALAKAFKARLQVVSVAPSPATLAALARPGTGWGALGVLWEEMNETAKADLSKAAAYLRGSGVQASVELQTGRTAAAIVEFAVANGVDLVILGSHGHGLGERLNLGSVGSAVKHHVPCSVLVARGAPGIKRVLLATDGSQRSRLAVKVGRDVANALGAKAILAHAIDLGSYGLRRGEGAKRGKALMVEERMRESPGADGLETRIVLGPAAAQLRKLASREKAGLIVVGSRGLGGLKGLALGSVSDGLTHKADQSVLVVKPMA